MNRPPIFRSSPIFTAVKRCVDIAAALVGLAVVSPVLAICAWLIWRADGGSPLFCQWRVGCDGKLFQLYKLRTMRRDAERFGVRFAATGDARVLPLCTWMRRSHVDELPQLLNVLLGHMSLVGPRPERPEVMEQLRMELPRFEWRLAAAPGLTGLAQVRNGYSSDLRGMRRKLALDLQYLQRRSIAYDLLLLVRTVPKLWDRAAC